VATVGACFEKGGCEFKSLGLGSNSNQILKINKATPLVILSRP